LSGHCLSLPPFLPLPLTYLVLVRTHHTGNQHGHLYGKLGGKHTAVRLHQAAEVDLKGREGGREGGREVRERVGRLWDGKEERHTRLRHHIYYILSLSPLSLSAVHTHTLCCTAARPPHTHIRRFGEACAAERHFAEDLRRQVLLGRRGKGHSNISARGAAAPAAAAAGVGGRAAAAAAFASFPALVPSPSSSSSPSYILLNGIHRRRVPKSLCGRGRGWTAHCQARAGAALPSACVLAASPVFVVWKGKEV